MDPITCPRNPITSYSHLNVSSIFVLFFACIFAERSQVRLTLAPQEGRQKPRASRILNFVFLLSPLQGAVTTSPTTVLAIEQFGGMGFSIFLCCAAWC